MPLTKTRPARAKRIPAVEVLEPRARDSWTRTRNTKGDQWVHERALFL